jgi:16S rRNA (uracil1498-N3)-methyltransferase
MNIFFSQNIQGDSIFLDETESHHCIRVLRLSAGENVIVVDGKGGFYKGILAVPDHRACVISISTSEQEYGKRDYSIHIAIAPTKNIERFEWFLEKATEIGIDKITPLICTRSERRVVREDRLEKVVLSAVKQSLKAYRPELNSPVAFEEFIRSGIPGIKLIAHCTETSRQDLIKIKPSSRNFTLLIGPEGDFTSAEITAATHEGFIPVSLGSSRLRTETAGVSACQIIADLTALN